MSTSSDPIIDQFEIGPLQNFIYFIGDRTTGEVAVVDPAWNVPFLLKEARQRNYTIKYVFLTHGHPDHVNGLDELLENHNVPVYLAQREAAFYKPDCKNLEPINDNDILKLGAVEFRCIHTPGHTPGCMCFLTGKHILTGDTLFVDGCGRCDLPGGNPRSQDHSLMQILSKLPDETVIYPGHNYGFTPTDTIGNQKETNPYLLCASEEKFLSERMGL